MATITIVLNDNQDAKDFVWEVKRMLSHRMKRISIEENLPVEDFKQSGFYIPDYPQEEDDT